MKAYCPFLKVEIRPLNSEQNQRAKEPDTQLGASAKAQRSNREETSATECTPRNLTGQIEHS